MKDAKSDPGDAEPGLVRELGTADHRVIHGDALLALDRVPDRSCNLVFLDPPYNIGKKFKGSTDKWGSVEEYVAWCTKWLDICIGKLTDDGSMYLMASTQSMPYLDIYLRERLTILSRIVWSYDSSGVQAKNYFGSTYEPILFAVVNKKNYCFDAEAVLVEARTGAKRKLIDYRKPVPTEYASTKVPGNVWYMPRVRYRMPEYEEHPSQKPEVLLERIIKASTRPGDVVLDPFSGTFTTSAVAQRLGRKSIGIEYSPDYVGIGLRRLGIAAELDGTILEPVKKTTSRRSNWVPPTSEPQLPLEEAKGPGNG